MFEEWSSQRGCDLRELRGLVPHGLLSLILVLTLTAPRAYAGAEDTREVAFNLHAPQARSVEVIGDFNQWQSGAMPLAGPDETGMWRVKLTLPATLSRIEYIYWVDGAQRIADLGQPVVKDGFSGVNNVRVFP